MIMAIKVLHIIESLGVGGMENGVVNLVNAIDSRFPSSVFCSKALGGLAKKVTNKNKVHYCKCKESLFVITFNLFKFCLFNRPDILHTHSWGTLISGYIVAKLLRIKLVHGEHGTVYFGSTKNLIVQRFIMSRTDMNLFVSRSLYQKFRSTLELTSKLKVIHNGVDSLRFKPQKLLKKEYLPAFEKEIIIGTVGRLVSVKNHIWLIDALSQLLGKEVKLVIVGDGELRGDISDFIVKEKLEEHVCMYGNTPTPELLMNCFDIFVLPSLSEGLSNTILEAMSCGLPIVAADVGGNSELVKNQSNGLLYESNNKVELVSCIRALVENSNIRANYGETSLRIVKEQFSMDVMLKNYQNTYYDVCK